jgi:O-antigen/teichoic acid export membrane protein
MAAAETSAPSGGGSPRRPAFARSALLTFGTNVGVAVLSFVSVLITARALGVDGRGELALLTTVAYLAGQLASMGVQQANANLAARNPHRSPSLAGTSIAIAAIAGALAAGTLGGLAAFFPALLGGVPGPLFVLALASVPMLILQVYLQQLVLAQYGFRAANLAWLLTPLTNVVVNGSLALAGALTVGLAVSSWIAGQLLTTVVLAWVLAKSHGGFGQPDARLAREVLGFGVKAHLGRVMLVGNYRVDQWILGIIAGSGQVGLYSVAVAWSEVLFFLPTAMAMVQRPDLARDSHEQAGPRATRVFRATMAATAALAIGMIALAPVLCTTIFGESFRGSVDMLRVLALGSFGVAALKLLGNALTAQRKPMLETAAIGSAFAATLGFDFLLIPAHGGLGAAIASTVAYSVGGVAVAAIFLRALGRGLGDLLPRPREILELARHIRGGEAV